MGFVNDGPSYAETIKLKIPPVDSERRVENGVSILMSWDFKKTPEYEWLVQNCKSVFEFAYISAENTSPSYYDENDDMCDVEVYFTNSSDAKQFRITIDKTNI